MVPLVQIGHGSTQRWKLSPNALVVFVLLMDLIIIVYKYRAHRGNVLPHVYVFKSGVDFSEWLYCRYVLRDVEICWTDLEMNRAHDVILKGVLVFLEFDCFKMILCWLVLLGNVNCVEHKWVSQIYFPK